MEVFFWLGKYGTIYKNYLKEYEKICIIIKKSKGKLGEHCYERKLEFKDLKERLEKQVKLNNPSPESNEFIVIARYNQMVEELVNELLLKKITFRYKLFSLQST